jgi:DNA-binding transcriptional regulator YiaG
LANRINVRALREKVGLNRDDFGARVGASGRTIRRWENDEAEPSAMACKILYSLAEQIDETPLTDAEGPRRKQITAA